MKAIEVLALIAIGGIILVIVLTALMAHEAAMEVSSLTTMQAKQN